MVQRNHRLHITHNKSERQVNIDRKKNVAEATVC